MAGVFVSYRRDDSQGFAGRLSDDLGDILGEDRVFRDIEIPVGSDFTDVLHRAIAASDALLVVIGPHWASADGYGSRLFEPTDWVRTEIEAAIAQEKPTVPVLVGEAPMPGEGALPATIARLARIQAAVLSDRRWDDDVEDLADRLRHLCPALGDERPLPADAVTPAQVVGRIAERIMDEVVARRVPRISPPSLPPTFGQRVLFAVGRLVRRILVTAVVLALVYIGIRLFGDESMLSTLDALEARLRIGWERLQGYLPQL